MSDETILNVDDQEAQRYVKRRDLEAGGFSVIDATTGAEALRLIEQIKPAVVLLDVQLPDISGYDVCTYIKGKWPEVMVLMTSATFTESDRRTQGLDSGADSYLVQPAEPLELAAAVNAMLRIRRSEDALRGINLTLGAQVKERGDALSRAVNALKSSADRMRTLLQATYIFQGYMTPGGHGARYQPRFARWRQSQNRRRRRPARSGNRRGLPQHPGCRKRCAMRSPERPRAKPASIRSLVNLPDGERSFDVALRPVKNDAGVVIGIVSEAVETTQRLKAEAALRQSMKMEAIGQLTGGLAHDFNNLLTAVVGNLDLIRHRSVEANVRKWAENAFKAAERGSKLTSQLLAFSRTQKLDTAAVDLNGLIFGMKELLAQSLGPSHSTNFELSPGLPAVLANANQLELAILNLSLNSRDAMPDGGRLTISTARSSTDARYVTLTVADTGTGMPADVVARAFDPFFTTKPTGKGTGLGLSQVYGIVRQAGGEVSIDSRLGHGTKVILRLSVASQEIVTENEGSKATARAKKNEKLLVVDDDSDVRDIVSRVLAELGYDVRDVGSGEEALGVLTDFDPDLLVVDFAMPNMNGAEIVAAARARKAELKILFLSGYADTAVLEAAVGRAPLLHKPFRPAELAAAVRTALEFGAGPRGAPHLKTTFALMSSCS